MRWLGQSAQNCSSIVTKRESTRHRQRTKQALGRIHIVSTLKRNALGRNHIVSTLKRKRTGQKSHCVNTIDDTQDEEQPRTCTLSPSLCLSLSLPSPFFNSSSSSYRHSLKKAHFPIRPFREALTPESKLGLIVKPSGACHLPKHRSN